MSIKSELEAQNYAYALYSRSNSACDWSQIVKILQNKLETLKDKKTIMEWWCLFHQMKFV